MFCFCPLLCKCASLYKPNKNPSRSLNRALGHSFFHAIGVFFGIQYSVVFLFFLSILLTILPCVSLSLCVFTSFFLSPFLLSLISPFCHRLFVCCCGYYCTDVWLEQFTTKRVLHTTFVRWWYVWRRSSSSESVLVRTQLFYTIHTNIVAESHAYTDTQTEPKKKTHKCRAHMLPFR